MSRVALTLLHLGSGHSACSSGSQVWHTRYCFFSLSFVDGGANPL